MLYYCLQTPHQLQLTNKHRQVNTCSSTKTNINWLTLKHKTKQVARTLQPNYS